MHDVFHIPTIDELEDAPHRAVLYVLTASALGAERTLLQHHPDIYEPVNPRGSDPPTVPPPLRAATHLVLARIAGLKQALALYEGALVAAVHDDRCDDMPF